MGIAANSSGEDGAAGKIGEDRCGDGDVAGRKADAGLHRVGVITDAERILGEAKAQWPELERNLAQ